MIIFNKEREGIYLESNCDNVKWKGQPLMSSVLITVGMGGERSVSISMTRIFTAKFLAYKKFANLFHALFLKLSRSLIEKVGVDT